MELTPVEILEHLSENGHKNHDGHRYHPCLTRAEAKRARFELVEAPRRCSNGHLCNLWPCLTCNPHLGA